METVDLKAMGRTVKLVPAAQVQLPPGMAKLTPPTVQPLMSTSPPPPTPPDTLDNGHGLEFDMDGNDRFGCCMYAAVAHAVCCWLGRHGHPLDFDDAALVNRYLEIAGGDNGMTWAQITPEFLSGIIGPDGPYKSISWAQIDPNNAVAMKQAINQYGCVVMVGALPTTWLQRDTKPGGVWDGGRGISPNWNNGHAWLVTGWDSTGWICQTWQISPPIRITTRGVRSCDAQAVAFFGLPWLDARGRTPTGLPFSDLKAWWEAAGGPTLPDLFPDDDRPEPIPPDDGGDLVPGYDVKLTGTMKAGRVELSGTATAQDKTGPMLPYLKARLIALQPGELDEPTWRAIVDEVCEGAKEGDQPGDQK